MDWSKAKNTLLLIFLVLNGFLVFSLRAFYFGESVSQKTIDDALKVLENSGVTVKCEIPRKTVDFWKLKYDTDDEAEARANIISRLLGTRFDSGDIGIGAVLINGSRKVVVRDDRTFEYFDEKPAGSIDISDRNDVLNHARKFFFNLGLPFKSYHLDSYVSNADGSISVLFIEYYNSFYVYDNYLNVTVIGGGVTHAVCSYKKTGSVEIDRLGGRKLIDAYIMLVKNFSEAGDVTITGIDLGFRKPSSKSDVTVMSLSPYWRVRLGSGEELYFRASDGEKE